jgi:hypothetical protein
MRKVIREAGKKKDEERSK